MRTRYQEFLDRVSSWFGGDRIAEPTDRLIRAMFNEIRDLESALHRAQDELAKAKAEMSQMSVCPHEGDTKCL